jgi:hypothetical protein
VPFGLRLLIAVAAAGLILWLGVRFFQNLGATGRREQEPEEVEDLAVYFVCGECGTEYKVTRLGELHVPRHCGEEMQVVRRAAGAT